MTQCCCEFRRLESVPSRWACVPTSRPPTRYIGTATANCLVALGRAKASVPRAAPSRAAGGKDTANRRNSLLTSDQVILNQATKTDKETQKTSLGAWRLVTQGTEKEAKCSYHVLYGQLNGDDREDRPFPNLERGDLPHLKTPARGRPSVLCWVRPSLEVSSMFISLGSYSLILPKGRALTRDSRARDHGPGRDRWPGSWGGGLGDTISAHAGSWAAGVGRREVRPRA
ncbi:hypothetical protein BGZ61DRAFT_472314 [Ilyonectria robusta]|uniref:uncharacterized protein n=1 Tax=Ilyonectria robusta TaxID=1079257 RepID=UPI001E8C9F53|nr:uncharacterized protein BGZ61DRAFT_472314 [Ilyonectria robusta]KAH8735936.1 hypothetical protein BGZ61DRAFT_472314 [Ilyonectria robusta]